MDDKSKLDLFSETFTVDFSHTFLFLVPQRNCSGPAKQDACKVTPRPRTYKVNVPLPFSEPAMRGRAERNRAKARHLRQPDGTECRAEWPLLCPPQRPAFSTLAPSTAPPHMPDITVCNPPPPPHHHHHHHHRSLRTCPLQDNVQAC